MPLSKSPARKAGRPTKFQAGYAAIAKRLALLGARDIDLAAAFEVNLSTIKAWKTQIPEFAAAVAVGKEVANDHVERAIYERAVGYDFPSVKVNVSEGQVFKTPVDEHMPPDVQAARWFLANRRPKDWSLTPSRRIELPLGDFKGSEGLTVAMAGIAKAMASGAISAAEAEAMGRVVDAVGDAYARQVIEERLAAVENRT